MNEQETNIELTPTEQNHICVFLGGASLIAGPKLNPSYVADASNQNIDNHLCYLSVPSENGDRCAAVNMNAFTGTVGEFINYFKNNLYAAIRASYEFEVSDPRYAENQKYLTQFRNQIFHAKKEPTDGK